MPVPRQKVPQKQGLPDFATLGLSGQDFREEVQDPTQEDEQEGSRNTARLAHNISKVGKIIHTVKRG